MSPGGWKAPAGTGRAAPTGGSTRRGDRRPRLAFVGLGWIGGLRLDALDDADAARPAVVCDLDAERLREYGGRYPDARVTDDLGDVLANGAAETLDGVVLATPNAVHAEQAVACIERGLPLFVQKPLGVSSREVARVLRSARKENVAVGVDYSYRWLEGARRLRALAQGGELGEIRLIEATFHNAYGPDKAWCFDRDLSGGGCLLDLGVHLLDLAFWTFGVAEPRNVRARVDRDGPEVERFVAAEMDLGASGPPLRLTCSWHAHAGKDCDFRFTVFGTEGGAEIRSRGGSFYDFELAVRRGRSEEVVATDARTWMDQGIVRWARDLGRGGGRFDPEAWTNVAVAEAVEAIMDAGRA